MSFLRLVVKEALVRPDTTRVTSHLADTRNGPPEERARPLRRGAGGFHAAAFTVLLSATLAATLWAWHHAGQAQRRDHRADLVLAVDDVRLRFEARLGEMAAIFAEADALFSGAGPVSPASFATFAERTRRHGGAPHGVGFAQRVPAAGAEAAVVVHGGRAFGTKLGFDAMADPERRKALQRARDTGRPAVGRRRVLLSGQNAAPDEQRFGLVAYSPVYRNGDPGTVPSRRAHLIGWTGIAFSPGEMLAEIEAQVPRPLDLEVAEAGAAEPPLARTATGPRAGRAGAGATVDVYGAPWYVTARPGSGFSSGSFDPRLLLYGGLAATLAIGALGVALLRARGRRDDAHRAHRLAESEARLRAAVSAAPDLIVLVDGEDNIVFASDQVRPLLGYDPEQLVGHPLEVLLPECVPSANLRHRDGFGTTEALSMAETAEVMARRSDGTELPVIVTLAPVEGAGGEALVAVVVRDAEHVLQDEQELMANVANFSSDAFLTVDLCGWVTSWNVGAEGLYGWTAAEALGRHISFIVPREHHQEAADSLARARAGEEVPSRPTVRMRRGGARVDVSVTECPTRDRSGRITGVASISRDISEEQATRESLVRYATELERSTRDLEEYASITAHDLSEPLRVVGCSADLLRSRYGRSRPLDDAGVNHLESITGGVERMRQLIERVLSLSQLRTGRRDHGPVDLTAVLAEVRTKLAPLIEESRAEFFPADLPVVWGDGAQLTLLVENLVSNALKFRHPGRAVRIVVGATATDSERQWEVSVSDNGIGIDPVFHDRIFEMFRRVHNPATFEGAGIGLALCRQIVNLHGGEIRVQSEPGQGSVFTMTLPASRVDGPASRPSGTAPQAVSATRSVILSA